MKKILVSVMLISFLVNTGCDFSGGCFQGYGPVISQVREISDFTSVSNAGDFEVRVTMSDTFGVEVEAQENLHEFIEIYVSGSNLVVKTKDNVCFNSIAAVLVFVTMPYIEEISNTGSGRLSADRAESSEFECSNSGSGQIAIDSIFASTIMLNNSGSGSLYVTASYPDEIDMSQTGSGLISAGFIYAPLDVSINHTSSGKIYASVIDGLDVDVSLTGSGLVAIDGNAETAGFGLSSSGKIDGVELMVADAEAMSSGSGRIYVYATDYLNVTISGSGNIYYRGNPVINSRISGSGSLKPY